MFEACFYVHTMSAEGKITESYYVPLWRHVKMGQKGSFLPLFEGFERGLTHFHDLDELFARILFDDHWYILIHKT